MSVPSSVATAGKPWRPNIFVTVCTALAVLAGAAKTVQAQGDTLRVAAAVAIALESNPSLQAARLRVDAARERAPQAGAFPDPVLSLGLMNRPLDGFGTGEPMTMNTVQLTQRLPWPGTLGFAEDRMEHLALAEEFDAAEVEHQLAARVKSVYFDLAYTDRALAVMRETRELLRSFQDVASAMYGAGRGLQQDVLQAQVAVARVSEDITVLEQERLASAARLNALLGRDGPVGVPALELPAPIGETATVDSLMALASTDRPALQAARARADAAQAGYRAARRQLFPDIMVTVGYGQRPQYTDMLSVMVGISLPIWAGNRQIPMRREMLAEQAEREAGVQALSNETYARITELRAQIERARSLTRLYATSILPQARAAVESALSAYRVGSVDYMTLMNNQLTVNRYAIEMEHLAADYQRATAELEALIGRDFGGGQ